LNSDGLIIRRNRILHAMDASGAGIALKEISAALVVGNEIVHCAHGIMADSPTNPINRIVFINNLIAHNITGIYFYGVKGGHIAINNTFRSNLWPVSIVGDGDPMNDVWWGNSWDNYEGFDLDRRHRRPPHELYAWADRIWIENPSASFSAIHRCSNCSTSLNDWRRSRHANLILRDTEPRDDAATVQYYSELVGVATALHRHLNHPLRQMRGKQCDQIEIVAPQIAAPAHAESRGVGPKRCSASRATSPMSRCGSKAMRAMMPSPRPRLT
jgi:hypothetical protein